MSGWQQSAVTIATILPAAGAIALAFVPRSRDRLARALGIGITGAALGVGIAILATFDYGPHSGLQFELDTKWITAIGARFHVGLDGISLPLFELTLLLTFLCAIYTWRFLPQPGNAKAFVALILLLETGMAGTFIAFDLVLFFVFWELVLIPMYFLIGVWGSGRREYAAIKFFLFTITGSVLMLLSFIGAFFHAHPHTFDIITLSRVGTGFSHTIQLLLFTGMFFGFAIKVPMWPLHTWLPDAHTEAPTVGSVLLAGILLKMGSYAFIRIGLPILPEAAHWWAPTIGVLGAIAIIYGSLCCLAQRDVKRLIAYSSVGHMGFVMLGIATLTPVGINAAVFGMVAHGVITGMLFFVAGSIHERYHTRDIVELGGGMAKSMPRLAGIFTLSCIASLVLPGLAGFWGEILALLAAWNPAAGLEVGLFRTLAVVGLIGTLLTAGYFLWLLQRVTLGRPHDRWSGRVLGDVAAVEYSAWTPLILLTVALGFLPRMILGVTNPAVVGWFANLFK